VDIEAKFTLNRRRITIDYLSVLFVGECEGIWEKAEEDNRMKDYVRNETCR
jgi:hypothetical protein